MQNRRMPQHPSAAERTAPETAAAPLIFEQPLNERMRTFLRLDYLYNQALYHNEKASQWGSRAAMTSLIDILAITTRSDVRSEVLKEIERHLAQLAEFEDRPGRRHRPPARPDQQPGAAAHGAVAPPARPTCSRCAIRNSWRPSSIAAPFPAAPASSTCRTISSG